MAIEKELKVLACKHARRILSITQSADIGRQYTNIKKLVKQQLLWTYLTVTVWRGISRIYLTRRRRVVNLTLNYQHASQSLIMLYAALKYLVKPWHRRQQKESLLRMAWLIVKHISRRYQNVNTCKSEIKQKHEDFDKFSELYNLMKTKCHIKGRGLWSTRFSIRHQL